MTFLQSGIQKLPNCKDLLQDHGAAVAPMTVMIWISLPVFLGLARRCPTTVNPGVDIFRLSGG